MYVVIIIWGTYVLSDRIFSQAVRKLPVLIQDGVIALPARSEAEVIVNMNPTPSQGFRSSRRL